MEGLSQKVKGGTFGIKGGHGEAATIHRHGFSESEVSGEGEGEGELGLFAPGVEAGDFSGSLYESSKHGLLGFYVNDSGRCLFGSEGWLAVRGGVTVLFDRRFFLQLVSEDIWEVADAKVADKGGHEGTQEELARGDASLEVLGED